MTESVLRIEHSGSQMSIQDQGRYEYLAFGVPRGGAMDRGSLQFANLLVGNQESAAGIEVAIYGGAIRWEHSLLVSVGGGDLQPRWYADNGVSIPFPQGRPVLNLKPGTLRFGSSCWGARAYLAVAGGIDVPIVLGGRATLLRSRLGGFQGRALRKGDRIPFGSATKEAREIEVRLTSSAERSGDLIYPEWSVRPSLPAGNHFGLRVTEGKAWKDLDPRSQIHFLESTFVIQSASDRMGYRLQGAKLQLPASGHVRSEGVAMGTIQLPPGGDPILLMADCAPTGGYPRIAHVISADLDRAGQLRPGNTVRFSQVSLEEARQLWCMKQQEIRSRACFLTSLSRREIV